MYGEESALLDNSPAFSIFTNKYCTIGQVCKKEFQKICLHAPRLSQAIMTKMFANPHDEERDWFIEVCRSNIEYLKAQDEHALKELYYRSKKFFLYSTESVITAGNRCNTMYIIVSGVIDIVIQNTKFKGVMNYTLDILGRGSVIGQNYILSNEKWYYSAVNKSTMPALILAIPLTTIQRIEERHPELRKAIVKQMDINFERGLTQIDYVVHTDQSLSSSKLNQTILSLKKQVVWNKHHHNQ